MDSSIVGGLDWMDDYMIAGHEHDYYCYDPDSPDVIENGESDFLWVTLKGTKVMSKESVLAAQPQSEDLQRVMDLLCLSEHHALTLHVHHDTPDVIENEDFYVLRSSTKIILKDFFLASKREDLRRVMDLLSLREHHARTLLIHYGWDVEKLLAVLVDKGEASLFTEAGLTVKEDTSSSLPFTFVIMCNTCLEEDSGDKVTKMDCGHSFCNDCWAEHFIVKIKEGQSRRIRCMEHECNAICDEAVVRNLVHEKHPDLAEKFDFLLESYIEENKMAKWCPSTPQCGNALLVKKDQFCEVECACGLQFCFSCLSEPHSPCPCWMWELWTKKCQDESEEINWITLCKKSCPKCLKPVQKIGGCDLGTCVCGEQVLCWMCREVIGRDHTRHSCGRYKEDKAQKSERAKQDFDRYMHYFNRYKAHTDSFKLESKLKKTIFEVSTSEEWEPRLRDLSWASNGLCRLLRSRHVLSCSYPFAFYMFGEVLFNDEMTKEERETKQHLFEMQQHMFEVNIEKLSKLLEEPFDQYPDNKVMEIRIKVINLSGIIDNCCKKMYELIENDFPGCRLPGTCDIAP